MADAAQGPVNPPGEQHIDINNSPPHEDDNDEGDNDDHDHNNGNNDGEPPAWLAQLVEVLRPNANGKVPSTPPAKYSASPSQHAASFM
jgi:hypothetical protein